MCDKTGHAIFFAGSCVLYIIDKKEIIIKDLRENVDGSSGQLLQTSFFLHTCKI